MQHSLINSACQIFFIAATVVVVTAARAPGAAPDPWTVDTAEQWQQYKATGDNLAIADGHAAPAGENARFESVVKHYRQKRRAKQIVFTQVPTWDNWTATRNVGPTGTSNAPVFLPVADKDYWYFAAKQGGQGYHAWHSTDMQAWTHHGQITKSRWLTSAEYADGQFYFYYDQPNDEDPHLVIDKDLTDGKLGQDLGKVLADPSPGSDAGIFRDEDGTFHLIYEDWSPINARQHSWDSPLAGHADSPDGIHGFQPHEHPAPIDERTSPTGRTGTYQHPATGMNQYQIHAGPQHAYGDYTLIKVGSHYYIFCDYDPHDGPMRAGRWTSDSINKPFIWCGGIGQGFHPDPTIGFAEGKFYLLIQRAKQDFVSPGPWVDEVQARVGVDVDDDGAMDQWTEWQTVRERYSHKPGFARIVETAPAALDLSALPAGLGFKFEFKIEDATANDSKPVLDRVTVSFQ